MKIDQTVIEDTYAEGFGMRYVRLIVTAASRRWLDAAVREFSGYGSSVIQCDAEVGLEGYLGPETTFDGREGASVLAFGFSKDKLAEAVAKRAGQCLMTCATSAVFDGLTEAAFAAEQNTKGEEEEGAGSRNLSPALARPIPPKRKPQEPIQQERIPLGSHLRFFGDGFQQSKLLGDRRFWRIPVMDGEFICEESLGVSKGIAGGNFLIQSVDQMAGLGAAERAVDAIAELPGVITPFPGGVVRSGSKVGSKYKSLIASTSHQFCPTLRGRVDSLVHPDARCVYEIVIDGIDFAHVAKAINCGIRASIGEGIIAISAGNYGGKLGKHHFPLHSVLDHNAAMDAD